MVRLAELTLPAGETVRLDARRAPFDARRRRGAARRGRERRVVAALCGCGNARDRGARRRRASDAAHDPPARTRARDVTARRLALVAAALTAAVLGVATWVYLRRERQSSPRHQWLRPRATARAAGRRARRRACANGSDPRISRAIGRFSISATPIAPTCARSRSSRSRASRQQLAAEQPAARIEYYLVSVDPQRDTPERLREYVAYFDSDLPRSHGLAGARSRRSRKRPRRCSTCRRIEMPITTWSVTHRTSCSSIPTVRVHAVFTPPHDPARLAADFTKVAARYDCGALSPRRRARCNLSRLCVD